MTTVILARHVSCDLSNASYIPRYTLHSRRILAAVPCGNILKSCQVRFLSQSAVLELEVYGPEALQTIAHWTTLTVKHLFLFLVIACGIRQLTRLGYLDGLSSVLTL